jgi:glycosyltransferase involved in cell wall biosynthesis
MWNFIGGDMKIIFLDFSTKLKTIKDLESQARGGMVTSLFRVSDALSQLGNEVFVVSDIKNNGMTKAGVIWCAENEGCWLKGEQWDFLVLNRGIGEGYVGINAKHRILWTHDLPHNGFIQEPKMMNVFSGVVFMSRYAEHIWRSFYRTIGRSFFIPNGVDKDLFYPRPKNYEYLIFGSAPNRGLKRLPLIYDAIKSRLSDRRIIFNAYSNMASMHPNESAMEHDYAQEYTKVRECGVDLTDPLPQPEFAKALGHAGLMILPTDYPEICSNSILQSLASGTPVITTGGIGSALQVHDYMIHTLEMVRNSVKVLENRELHQLMIKGAAKTKIFSWGEIGAQWQKMLKKIL